MLQRQRVLTADPSFVGCGGGTSCSFIGSAWFGLPACRNSSDRLHDNDTLETNGTYFQTFSAWLRMSGNIGPIESRMRQSTICL